MNLAKRVTEASPSIRWRLSAVRTAAIYRKAFGHIGDGTVIVNPRQLRGDENIYLGSGIAIYSGGWLQCEPGAGPIRIGDRTYLGHDVHVHAIDPITIGDRVFIGQRAIVLGASPLATAQQLGAGAVVTKDVPGGAVVAGVPAKVIGAAS